MTASTFRRCGCAGYAITRQGKCPRLAADPEHGSWGAVVELGRVNGKRKQRRKQGFRTEAEALRWAETRTPGERPEQSLGEFVKHWLTHERGKPRMWSEHRDGKAFSIPVEVLLSGGHCTAQCLLAFSDDPLCDCRCGEEFHGALLGARVRIELPQDTERDDSVEREQGRAAAEAAVALIPRIGRPA